MLDAYKRRLLSQGRYMGEALKKQSDMIMDATFTRDIAYRLCYIDEKPIDAKYIVYTYYSLSGDAVDYHLQFRPGVHYPIGTYIDVPDDTKTYHRWLIVGRSDEPQFVKYNILKCNWTFKWIVDGKIYECLGILRKRMSYNSGIWHNFLTTTPENQDQFIVPTTPETQTINYNQRFLISDNQINPIAWEITKVEDTMPRGITYFTLKQDLYDPRRDNKELMIADYYKSSVMPEPPHKEHKIKFNKPSAVKVGGSYKAFSVVDPDEKDVYSWRIQDIQPECLLLDESDPTKIRIKVVKDYSLIGKVFTLELYTNEELSDSIFVEVMSI